jgi:hypothetical protein
MSEAVLDWDRFKFKYDRTSFKLYACKQHLKNLKYIESKYGSLDSTQAQNTAEIEIDAFLNQMIGTVDSLLFKINNKFRLNISVYELEIDKVQSVRYHLKPKESV